MKFGILEMREFAEKHEDIRIRLIWERLEETRSKLAKFQEQIVKLESQISKTLEKNK
jgi:hypothetical protein